MYVEIEVKLKFKIENEKRVKMHVEMEIKLDGRNGSQKVLKNMKKAENEKGRKSMYHGR